MPLVSFMVSPSRTSWTGRLVAKISWLFLGFLAIRSCQLKPKLAARIMPGMRAVGRPYFRRKDLVGTFLRGIKEILA